MSSDVIEDRSVLPVMEALLGCLCAALEDSPGGSPCFCGLLPGALVAMDYVDCDGDGCGQAWVRLDSVYPSTRFPTLDLEATCRSPQAARVQLGVLRCVPGMDADGTPPDEVAQAEATRIQLGDRAALQRAVECCFDRPHRDYMLGQYAPIGPSGGAGGGALVVTVRL